VESLLLLRGFTILYFALLKTLMVACHKHFKQRKITVRPSGTVCRTICARSPSATDRFDVDWKHTSCGRPATFELKSVLNWTGLDIWALY